MYLEKGKKEHTFHLSNNPKSIASIKSSTNNDSHIPFMFFMHCRIIQIDIYEGFFETYGLQVDINSKHIAPEK